jgi:hypothetical protein
VKPGEPAATKGMLRIMVSVVIRTHDTAELPGSPER